MTFTRPASSIKPVPALAYSYDAVGNITKVVSGTDTLAEYTYDNQNQLVSEDDGQYLTTYTYDTYGNIRSIWVRDSETYSAVLETYEFSYADDRDWKDQLTGVTYTDYNSDGKESGMLTYDAMGNPLTYFNGKKNWNFTWKYGRQLASATDGIHTITNTYDVDGVRESKTVDGVEHKYVTLDGKIIRETYGTVTVDYFYDNEGRPYKLVVDADNSTSGGSYTGYFVLNQQGDVIAILNANGAKAVSYEYNAWGQILSEDATTEVAGALFLKYNALKYRGYYYDAETGFYYVSSRYYDPVIGRFINADTTDVLMASPTSLTDKNLYAYCDNNPVMRVDSDGDWWHVAVGAAVGFAAQYASNVVDNLISGESFLDSIAIKKSDIPGLLGAAASGALVATGISPEVLSFANAAINTVSYISECQITGRKIDSVELAVSVGVGFISDFTGDGGINGKKLRETYDTASKYITKSISSKKKNMYVAKQTAIKSKVKKEIRNTFIGTWSNSKICKALTSGIKWIGKWFK